jgi:hypothetical protein
MGFYYEPVLQENRERSGNFITIRAQFSVRLKEHKMYPGVINSRTPAFLLPIVAGVPLTHQHGIQWVMGLAE